jgi:hypothetical protein
VPSTFIFVGPAVAPDGSDIIAATAAATTARTTHLPNMGFLL